MAIEIRVPQMGESVTEGVIATWLKAEGDSVDVDEPIVEVETDKITVEVPAPAAGVLTKHAVAEGDTVNVGDVLGVMEAGDGAAASAPASSTPKAAPTPTPSQPPAAPSAAPAMPAAEAEAARRGIDIGTVAGTGLGGRVLKEDVQKTAASTPTPVASVPPPAARPALPQITRPTIEREIRKPMTPLRRRVAQRLVESQNTAAILTTFNELDVSAMMNLRKRWKERFVEQHGVKLGFMSFFVKATVDALKEYPSVNAEIDGDDVVYKNYYDIGVAVGSGKGLVVPVIRDADRLSFADVEKSIAELAGKAKTNKLTLEDLAGGTFTISNGGVYGSMMSTPIVNPPQTGILGLHNIVERPVAINGEVVIRPVMYLALSYDHRLIDGREAVQFLVRIKTLLEEPERLFLGV